MARYLMVKGQEAAPPAEEARVPIAVDQPASVAAHFRGRHEIWPSGVPGPELASKILTGQADAGPWLAPTQRLLGQLSEVESLALYGRPSPVDLTPLRNAILTRWRLAVALEHRPPPGTAIDGRALEALLTEVDAVLANIQASATGNDAVTAALTAARGALARDAVALSEIAADEAHRAATAAADAKATKKYQHVARMVSVSTETAKLAVRSKALWAITIASVLGAGAYHGYHFLAPRPAPSISNLPSDLPPGIVGFKEDTHGIMVLTAFDKQHLPDAAALQQLKAKAEATGRVFHQVAPGEYIIAPPTMRIPDMSSTPQEPK